MFYVQTHGQTQKTYFDFFFLHPCAGIVEEAVPTNWGNAGSNPIPGKGKRILSHLLSRGPPQATQRVPRWRIGESLADMQGTSG